MVFSLILVSYRFISLFLAALIGYYQSMVRKENIIKLPFSFYKKLEACIPADVKSRSDFIPISSVEANLKAECCGGSGSGSGNSERENRNNSRGFQNPFAR